MQPCVLKPVSLSCKVSAGVSEKKGWGQGCSLTRFFLADVIVHEDAARRMPHMGS